MNKSPTGLLASLKEEQALQPLSEIMKANESREERLIRLQREIDSTEYDFLTRCEYYDLTGCNRFDGEDVKATATEFLELCDVLDPEYVEEEEEEAVINKFNFEEYRGLHKNGMFKAVTKEVELRKSASKEVDLRT